LQRLQCGFVLGIYFQQLLEAEESFLLVARHTCQPYPGRFAAGFQSEGLLQQRSCLILLTGFRRRDTLSPEITCLFASHEFYSPIYCALLILYQTKKMQKIA
jgi:hypothetical protein